MIQVSNPMRRERGSERVRGRREVKEAAKQANRKGRWEGGRTEEGDKRPGSEVGRAQKKSGEDELKTRHQSDIIKRKAFKTGGRYDNVKRTMQREQRKYKKRKKERNDDWRAIWQERKEAI